MSKYEVNNMNSAIRDDLPPAYSAHHHACLALNRSDRIRLIRFPSAFIGIVRQAILQGWERGIQGENEYAGAYEFKLNGNPWIGHGVESVDSRLLMISVLSALHNNGWYLLTSTDISKKQNDKDSLIFQLGTPPEPTSFFAVSFNEFDKLRVISAPINLIAAVRQTLGQSEIQREEWMYSKPAYQFKLRGYPWSAVGDEAVTTRIRILSLLDCFSSFGWQLHGSIDMSAGSEGCDTDTWILRRTNA